LLFETVKTVAPASIVCTIIIVPTTTTTTTTTATTTTTTIFFLIKPTGALIFQIYFCQEILRVSGGSCAHHQEFFTVHSALVYVMRV